MTRQWYGNQKVVEGWYGRIGAGPFLEKVLEPFLNNILPITLFLGISELYFQP